MSILTHLASLAVKGGSSAASELTGLGVAGAGVDALVGVLTKQFSDHSHRLTKALEKASTRAWRAVELSMAGQSWWDRCKVALATADDRAIRRQVQAYLDAHPLDGVDGHGPDFRAQCLAQLQGARKAGLLDRGKVDPAELARQVGDLSRFGDPGARVDAEYAILDTVADNLRQAGYEALATFLTLRPADGPPLLVSAMRYFFQREVEHDRELFQGLTHARLEALSDGQNAGFTDLAEVLDASGARLEGLLADVQAVVVRTHGDVLDIKAELARQGQQMNELGQAVLSALAQQKLERRELQGSDSFSLRDEGERRLVRDLVRRYRSMPSEERQRMPALLNAVGKLQVMAGDFEAAEKDFRDVSRMVDGPARAEAAYNAYRAALEARAWADALGSLREAIGMDPTRFAPFPSEKFEPERILGAGGFGVAILCRNRHSGGKVVIKTLRRDGFDRDLGEIFREAQALEELEHPAIIRVRDCDYADAAKTRPYFVMDFFEGQTLADYVEQYGSLEPAQLIALASLIASGLEKAHARGILHRDVKPGNILVRQTPSGWQAKLIDFGLALRASASGSTMKASLDRTLNGASIAGTIEYAAPEQMGKLKGVAVGPYSDVYGFAKTCCFALFATAQPTYQHWQSLPPGLADLLGRCLNEQPRARPQSFTEVLSELARRESPKKKPIVDVPIMDVLPVAKVEPVRPSPSRSGRLRAPEPVPRPRRERYLEERPTKQGSSGALIVFGVMAFVVLIAVGGFLTFGFRGKPDIRPVGSSNAFVPWADTGPKSAFPPDLTKVEAIPPTEFPAILAELRKKPDIARLCTLAGRLAKTEPTETQKKQHDAFERMNKQTKENAGGPDQKQLDRAKSDDDITQVAMAISPLMDQPDLENRYYGATALQKWGTTAQVKGLIGLLDTGSSYAHYVRIAAMKALGTIGDPEAIPPVLKRLDSWEASQESALFIDAMAAFGPKIEKEMWPYLEGNHELARHGGIACGVLERVGTEKSLPVLEKIKGNVFVQPQAPAAIAAINLRIANKK